MLRASLCFLIVFFDLIARFSPAAAETFKWLQLGPSGLEARVITDAPGCPPVQLDETETSMTVRASPGETFPVTVCEAPIPSSVHSVAIAGVSLASPPVTDPKRIAVIGDTGCRLKRAIIFRLVTIPPNGRLPRSRRPLHARSPISWSTWETTITVRRRVRLPSPAALEVLSETTGPCGAQIFSRPRIHY